MNTINKIKYTVLATALLIGTVSCQDYLDTPPSDQLTSDGFYETPTQINQGVVGIYSGLENIAHKQYLYMMECRSDNTWVDPRPNGVREYSEIGTFRATQDQSVFNDVWNDWYKIIYNANVILSKIEAVEFNNEEMKKQFLGEASFMRGWAYFELVRLFGNIPVIDSPLTPAEVQEIGQSTPREVYEKIIIPDLIRARDNLPLDADMIDDAGKGVSGGKRADRIAAQAMLGRAYLTMAGFPVNDTSAKTLAATELKSVIDFSENNGDMYWAPDSTAWRKQWIPTATEYAIFTIQYSSTFPNQIPFYNSPNLPTSYISYDLFGNSIYVEKTLMYEFDKVYGTATSPRRDARGHGHTILAGYEAEPDYPAYSQVTESLTLSDGTVVDVPTRTMFYKYMPSKRKVAELGLSVDVESTMTAREKWPVNMPIIRLEDVQLMYAEIMAETNITEAMKYVNKIRERAGCDTETATTPAQALDFVKRERRLELADEGVRWGDIVRWGEWQTNIKELFTRYNVPDGTDLNNVKDGRYLYPIPLNQLNARPGLYTQNEGY